MKQYIIVCMITNLDKQFMRRAVELSEESLDGGGLPFGAVMVKEGRIVAEGRSMVRTSCDPTAHAEVVAIRQAAEALATIDLSDCVLYTSCEPCVMCVGAIYWAQIKAVYYANTQFDAKALGVDDGFIYGQLNMSYDQRAVPFQQVLDAMALEVFDRAMLEAVNSA